MIATALLFLYAAAASGQTSAPPAMTRDQAQAQADIGKNQLHLGRLADAQSNCDAALKADPANQTAKECLDAAASMLVDHDLNDAEAKLLSGDKPGAKALAAKWLNGAASAAQRQRARRILSSAQSHSPREIYQTLTPDWLRQVLVTIGILVVLSAMLLAARKLWREWVRGAWYGSLVKKTTWSMIPLKELPETTAAPTGVPTDAVLDALSRVGPELQRELWQPKLLLLRPTPPADHEPALISEFLSGHLPSIVIAPPAPDLCVEWELHDVQLDQAVANLQLKAGLGIDIGSVARFLRSVVQWFNAGGPTLSGVAQTSDKGATIHLAARGGRTNAVAITSSTDAAPGIDPVQLSAERAAVKFLFRMRYPNMTNEEIDGFSALRQGAVQFAQFAGTVPGLGDDAKARTSSLRQAGNNFAFFRASIPLHATCYPKNVTGTSLDITDDVRQSALLAEGVAYALIGEPEAYASAIGCFRQLQDWPGSPVTVALRQQGAYNEAVVWSRSGNLGRSVLLLTELLGEKAPDTISSANPSTAATDYPKPDLDESIRFPARLARLATFARYTRDDWSTLPPSRAGLLIDDAEKLVPDLEAVCSRAGLAAHDLRLAKYMYTEALRCAGHVELLRVIAGPAKRLYRNQRPLGLMTESLDPQAAAMVKIALSHLLACEQLSPSCGLYCDLAEAYLLLRDFGTANGYARHAALETNPYNEWAYYIATESFFLQHDDASLVFARKYASSFKGTVTLDAFKSVREDLGISETTPANTPPATP